MKKVSDKTGGLSCRRQPQSWAGVTWPCHQLSGQVHSKLQVASRCRAKETFILYHGFSIHRILSHCQMCWEPNGHLGSESGVWDVTSLSLPSFFLSSHFLKLKLCSFFCILWHSFKWLHHSRVWKNGVRKDQKGILSLALSCWQGQST
jgi:hypothetical protein